MTENVDNFDYKLIDDLKFIKLYNQIIYDEYFNRTADGSTIYEFIENIKNIITTDENIILEVYGREIVTLYIKVLDNLLTKQYDITLVDKSFIINKSSYNNPKIILLDDVKKLYEIKQKEFLEKQIEIEDSFVIMTKGDVNFDEENHAMSIHYKKNKDDEYDFFVINRGDGCDHHNISTVNNETYCYGMIGIKISEIKLKNILCLIHIFNQIYSTKIFYNVVLRYLFYDDFNINISDEDLLLYQHPNLFIKVKTPMQVIGNCVSISIFSYLLINEYYRKFSTSGQIEYDISDFEDYNRFFYSLKEVFIYNSLKLYNQPEYLNKYNFKHIIQINEIIKINEKYNKFVINKEIIEENKKLLKNTNKLYIEHIENSNIIYDKFKKCEELNNSVKNTDFVSFNGENNNTHEKYQGYLDIIRSDLSKIIFVDDKTNIIDIIDLFDNILINLIELLRNYFDIITIDIYLNKINLQFNEFRRFVLKNIDKINELKFEELNKDNILEKKLINISTNYHNLNEYINGKFYVDVLENRGEYKKELFYKNILHLFEINSVIINSILCERIYKKQFNSDKINTSDEFINNVLNYLFGTFVITSKNDIILINEIRELLKDKNYFKYLIQINNQKYTPLLNKDGSMYEPEKYYEMTTKFHSAVPIISEKNIPGISTDIQYMNDNIICQDMVFNTVEPKINPMRPKFNFQLFNPLQTSGLNNPLIENYYDFLNDQIKGYIDDKEKDITNYNNIKKHIREKINNPDILYWNLIKQNLLLFDAELCIFSYEEYLSTHFKDKLGMYIYPKNKSFTKKITSNTIIDVLTYINQYLFTHKDIKYYLGKNILVYGNISMIKQNITDYNGNIVSKDTFNDYFDSENIINNITSIFDKLLELLLNKFFTLSELNIYYDIVLSCFNILNIIDINIPPELLQKTIRINEYIKNPIINFIINKNQNTYEKINKEELYGFIDKYYKFMKCFDINYLGSSTMYYLRNAVYDIYFVENIANQKLYSYCIYIDQQNTLTTNIYLNKTQSNEYFNYYNHKSNNIFNLYYIKKINDNIFINLYNNEQILYDNRVVYDRDNRINYNYNFNKKNSFYFKTDKKSKQLRYIDAKLIKITFNEKDFIIKNKIIFIDDEVPIQKELNLNFRFLNMLTYKKKSDDTYVAKYKNNEIHIVLEDSKYDIYFIDINNREKKYKILKMNEIINYEIRNITGLYFKIFNCINSNIDDRESKISDDKKSRIYLSDVFNELLVINFEDHYKFICPNLNLNFKYNNVNNKLFLDNTEILLDNIPYYVSRFSYLTDSLVGYENGLYTINNVGIENKIFYTIPINNNDIFEEFDYNMLYLLKHLINNCMYYEADKLLTKILEYYNYNNLCKTNNNLTEENMYLNKCDLDNNKYFINIMNLIQNEDIYYYYFIPIIRQLKNIYLCENEELYRKNKNKDILKYVEMFNFKNMTEYKFATTNGDIRNIPYNKQKIYKITEFNRPIPSKTIPFNPIYNIIYDKIAHQYTNLFLDTYYPYILHNIINLPKTKNIELLLGQNKYIHNTIIMPPPQFNDIINIELNFIEKKQDVTEHKLELDKNDKYLEDDYKKYIKKIKETKTKFINYDQINSLKIFINNKIFELSRELNTNIITNKLKIGMFYELHHYVLYENNYENFNLVMNLNKLIELNKLLNNYDVTDKQNEYDITNFINLYQSKPYWINEKEILSSIICFEYIFKNHIRKNQIDLINILYDEMIDANKQKNIYQLLMGEGKTSVVAPVLTLKLLYSHDNSIYNIVPNSLLKQTNKILNSILFKLDKNILKSNLNQSKSNKNVYVITDNNFKLDVLVNIHDEKFRLSKKDCFYIYDEIDEIADPLKSQLNIISDKHKPLKNGNTIFTIIHNFIYNLYFNIEYNEKRKILYQNGFINYPHLLDENKSYNETAYKIIYDIFFDVVSEFNEELKNILINIISGIDTKELKIPDVNLMILNNLYNFYTIIPTITKNIHRRHFGIEYINNSLEKFNEFKKIKKSTRDIFIPIPFSANEIPSSGSEFSDYLFNIALTIICFYDKTSFKTRNIDLYLYNNYLYNLYINEQWKKDEENHGLILFNELVNNVDTIVTFKKNNRFELDQKNFEIISDNFYRKSNLLGITHIKNYLINILLKTNIKILDSYLNISMTDILSSVFSKNKICFTGTPYFNIQKELNKKDEFREIKLQETGYGNIIASIVGLNRKTINIVVESYNNVIPYAITNNYDVIIDVGSFFINKNNLNIANAIMDEIIKQNKKYDIVVFVSENNDKLGLTRDKNIIKYENILIPLINRFYYYDQSHITGIDMKIYQYAKGLITLSPLNRFRDIAQGIFRMRNINKGQYVDFIITNNTNKILSANYNVIHHLLYKETLYHDGQMPLFMKQNMLTLYREYFINKNIYNLEIQDTKFLYLNKNIYRQPANIININNSNDVKLNILSLFQNEIEYINSLITDDNLRTLLSANIEAYKQFLSKMYQTTSEQQIVQNQQLQEEEEEEKEEEKEKEVEMQMDINKYFTKKRILLNQTNLMFSDYFGTYQFIKDDLFLNEKLNIKYFNTNIESYSRSITNITEYYPNIFDSEVLRPDSTRFVGNLYKFKNLFNNTQIYCSCLSIDDLDNDFIDIFPTINMNVFNESGEYSHSILLNNTEMYFILNYIKTNEEIKKNIICEFKILNIFIIYINNKDKIKKKIPENIDILINISFKNIFINNRVILQNIDEFNQFTNMELYMLKKIQSDYINIIGKIKKIELLIGTLFCKLVIENISGYDANTNYEIDNLLKDICENITKKMGKAEGDTYRTLLCMNENIKEIIYKYLKNVLDYTLPDINIMQINLKSSFIIKTWNLLKLIQENDRKRKFT